MVEGSLHTCWLVFSSVVLCLGFWVMVLHPISYNLCLAFSFPDLTGPSLKALTCLGLTVVHQVGQSLLGAW